MPLSKDIFVFPIKRNNLHHKQMLCVLKSCYNVMQSTVKFKDCVIRVHITMYTCSVLMPQCLCMLLSVCSNILFMYAIVLCVLVFYPDIHILTFMLLYLSIYVYMSLYSYYNIFYMLRN